MMMIRSKVAKIASGGAPCGVCGKKFKTEKTMEQQRKRYHLFLLPHLFQGHELTLCVFLDFLSSYIGNHISSKEAFLLNASYKVFL